MRELIEKSTEDLMETLLGADPEKVQSYLRQNFREGQPDFVSYIDRAC